MVAFYKPLVMLRMNVHNLTKASENDLRELCDEMCLNASQRIRLLTAVDQKRTLTHAGEDNNDDNNDNNNNNNNVKNEDLIAYAAQSTNINMEEAEEPNMQIGGKLVLFCCV